MTGSGPTGRPVRVLLACSGLEHARRGFESFARECFDTLRDEPLLDLELVKATGDDADRERAVPALKRDGRAAGALARLSGREPLHVEQFAFAFSLQPRILRRRPDVVYFSEWYTGVGLNLLRRVNRQDYALVMSNGSMAAEGFKWFDRVHQHTAPAYEYVLARGADPRRHTLLPVAFKMAPELEVPSDDERRSLRSRHGLPADRMIVISVAALNWWHKRLDYLIEEVALLPEPRPFLLLVGQPEPETEALRVLARERLGEDGHDFRTVSPAEVDELLRASDAFVLASLAEGLPRALVEGAARGLLCIAHDYPIPRYALGDHGRLGNFLERGALAELLREWSPRDRDPSLARERHRYVYERFSWDTLRPQYVDLLVGAKGRAGFDVPDQDSM
ncbi:MAG TPA: glycosyltransferase family 4 protein [Thermoleophilaceae bacterium]|nr:glycosyltransferase family 4 protein [Thermoleophilaceae bacterium]